MWNFRDLTGKKFGRLTVVSRAENSKGGQVRWHCICECETAKTVFARNLLSGGTKSCGCWKPELKSQRATRHGHTRGGRPSPEYVAWQGIRSRCNNPDDPNYCRYGGRGIRMWLEWDASFEAFLAGIAAIAAIGPRPSSKHSIDRIDNDRGYEPGNIRWATVSEQANNRRSNRRILIGDRTQTLARLARESGVNPLTIAYRIKKGWPEKVWLIPPGANSVSYLSMKGEPT
jgi:hypothetical protein